MAQHQDCLLWRFSSSRDQGWLDGTWALTICHVSRSTPPQAKPTNNNQAPLPKDKLHHPPNRYFPRKTPGLPPLDLLGNVRPRLSSHIPIHRRAHPERRHDDAMEDGSHLLDRSRCSHPTSLAKYNVYWIYSVLILFPPNFYLS